MGQSCPYCNAYVKDGSWHACFIEAEEKIKAKINPAPKASKDVLERLDTIIRLLKDMEYTLRTR